MYILTLTLAFMMIFSYFATATLQKFTDNNTVDIINESCFNTLITDLSHDMGVRADAALARLNTNNTPPDRKNLKRSIRLNALLDQDQSTSEAKSAKIILKSLILTLYENKTFFKEANMNGEQLDNFLDTIFTKAREIPSKNVANKAHALQNIELDNPLYTELRYKMWKGNTPQNNADINEQENYKSLKDFISFNKHKSASVISAYLAPKETLMAIFKNQNTVDSIINMRKEILSELKKKRKDTKEKDLALQQSFAEFKQSIADGIDKELVDFEVSKTDPDSYNAKHDPDDDI